ncbi:hypothetical protein ACFPK9_12320 [Rubritalea spongiae]|uniref:Uncharacterized protein n=1 Tax=Rubritalea spongiae TaxID=430797 RepID=A0ABW5E2Y7_9BACT
MKIEILPLICLVILLACFGTALFYGDLASHWSEEVAMVEVRAEK